MKKVLKVIWIIALLLLTSLVFLYCGFVFNRWDDPGVGIASIGVPFFKFFASVLYIIGFLMFYYLLGFIKKVKDKKALRLFCCITIPWILLFLLFTVFLPKNYKNCDYYTKEMNGGIKIFNGKQYKVELCGLKSSIDPDRYDEIRLRVFSMNDELLAERYYEPLLGLYYGKQLEYGENRLEYSYRSGGKELSTSIMIPPSRRDWIRARLPRMWP